MIEERPTNAAIRAQIQFHDDLNPKFWSDLKLRPEVRLKLFQSAFSFYRFLDVPNLIVRDIIFTGSNAAYNYTTRSDIDVHLLVDFSTSSCPALASNFFNTKKALWGKSFNISVRNQTLELYVEDIAHPVKANGVFSILHNKWLKVPNRTSPKENDVAIDYKVDALAAEIDGLLDGEPSIEDVNVLLRKLYTLRQNGLLNGGEFSVENLTFKVLRSLEYVERLYDKKKEIKDKQLSLT